MPAYAPAAQLAELAANPVIDAFRPKRPTVLSYGLGADSTAILLMYLSDPVAHGLEPDLSDLIVVHAVTGDEWEDSLSYCDRLALPLLRERRVRLVQVCRNHSLDRYGSLGAVFTLLSWLVGLCVVVAAGITAGAVIAREPAVSRRLGSPDRLNSPDP
ncbi:hypothetical protein ACFY0F_24105 [Streptomyces sp. NPDC001544]|uniref:hypothetical protein n=1 Tax=Streptomyces sp. NPDC001544 TaxID=3364584 RepID=UPI0036CBFA87